MKFKVILSFVVLSLFLSKCSTKDQSGETSELETKMNTVAEKYVKLVLEIGQYDPGYVDAYYGPAEWKPGNSQTLKMDSTSSTFLNNKVDVLLEDLESLGKFKATEIERLRFRFLYKQLLSIKGYVTMLTGGNFGFDREAEILYDANPPHYDDHHFQNIIDEIDKLLPGKGSITERWNNYRNQFIIPKEKLDKAFTAAIDECRKRTLQYIQLPSGENFKVEYVNNQPWGAYNWYKGNSFSVIQVNTDLPIYIDRAIDLASHEGYPGHHVFNTLLENELVKKRGWVEYSVYPLYSPTSLLAEGTANFGIEMIFPGNSAEKFEREILFPLAGLDSSEADLYYKIRTLVNKLDYATNEAARNYLDGKWDKSTTVEFLQNFKLVTKERAEKNFQFIEHYRSYVINYNLGKDLVSEYVKKNSDNDNYKRWELFKTLLTTPQTPSGLKEN
jgi:hypothetical protein